MTYETVFNYWPIITTAVTSRLAAIGNESANVVVNATTATLASNYDQHQPPRLRASSAMNGGGGDSSFSSYTKKNTTTTTATTSSSGGGGGVWPNPNILNTIAIDNTIIVISVNCGYVDIAQNWLLHIQRLGITNYLVVAQDNVVYPILTKYVPDSHNHVVLLNKPKEDVSDIVEKGSFTFWTTGFFKICQQRPYIIKSILQQGYNVIYSDSDLIWLQNPLLPTKLLPPPVDHGGGDGDGAGGDDDSDVVDYIGITDTTLPVSKLNYYQNELCTCLMYFKSTPNSLNMLNHWDSLMLNLPKNQQNGNDQNHWQQTIRDLHGQYKYKVLDSVLEFPPGYIFQDNYTSITANDNGQQVSHTFSYSNVDETKLYTMHANFIMGHHEKVNLFKLRNHWLVDKDNVKLKC